ncbi:MAG: sugar phosphate isomerase/epimerase [Candidatus Sumerlaeota bacterium]|nr:sugar phosphate isomerase/epimerase [Candidatus Sumerlaeota bacterium]
MTRRAFLNRGMAAGAGIGMLGSGVFGGESGAPFQTKLRTAVIIGKSLEEKTLAAIRAAGFDGVEWKAWGAAPEAAEAARKLVEAAGLAIHSMLGGGSQSLGDPAKAEAGAASIGSALKAAQACGATAILVVPTALKGPAAPEPWEFDVELDEATTHIKRVVAGDNAPYQEFIEAHNKAVDSVRGALKRLIPSAEKAGVVICLENLPNNFCVTPELTKSLVGSVQSPWVRAYFDTGNNMKYCRPSEEWIRVLGSLLGRCHVKDFKFAPDKHGGKIVNMREGDVDWPAVRKALDEIGYNGWMTIEGSADLSLEEQGKRMDLILAAK